MSQKRDELSAEFNKLAARAAELRSTEDGAEELITVTTKMRSIESELAVIDRQDGTAKVEIVAPKASSLGDAVVASRVLEQPIGSSVEIEGRDVYTTTQFPTPAGANPVFARESDAGIYALPSLPTSVLDLIPVIPTSSDVVRYFKQSSFTNNASGDAQLEASGKSEINWQSVVVPVAKAAHHIIVAKEVLADEPAVAALVNREGVRGVRETMETQLLSATNVTNGLQSIVATASSTTYSTEEGILTGIRKAKTACEVAGLAADFVVVSPAVREQIDLLALPDNGGVGYFAAGPTTLFGLRLVTSYRLPAGVDALVGSTQALSLRVRGGVEVETSNSHDDYFIKDGIAVKVSARAALANIRPEAFRKVSAAAA
jgi:HK97 family phage major capsid protein